MMVVNLFGPPGSGKSTVAAGVYHQLKVRGLICEFAQEYAKELVWSDSSAKPGQQPRSMEDQLSIFAEQNRRLERIRHQVDFVVTDSPLLLSLIYAPNYYPESFKSFVMDVFKSYHNVNFLLERHVPYQNIGRLHNEEQSKELGMRMRNMLDNDAVSYFPLRGDEYAVTEVMSTLFRNS